jgi:ERCC4-type nuclease
MSKKFKILIDTREQTPFFFDKLNDNNFKNLSIENRSLKTGDYSLNGFSDPDKHKKTICVERKSLPDLFSTLGSGRERFIKELIRMQKFTYSVIVIEGDFLRMIKEPPEYSKMSSKAVIRSLLAFSQRYNIPIFPCYNRLQAEKITFIILERFFIDHYGTFTKTGIFKKGCFYEE